MYMYENIKLALALLLSPQNLQDVFHLSLTI